MSMSKCKCDKIFDTDEELEFDERGECCCDNCYIKMMEEFNKDLQNCFDKTMFWENTVEKLMELGYRKVR